MKDFNLEDSKYITLDGNVWILPSSIAKLKGKDKNNYNNWTFTGYTRLLPGEEIRLIKGSEDWKQVLSAFRTKYQLTIAASEDVKLIDIQRGKAYFSIDKPQQVVDKALSMNNNKLNLPIQEEPTITSIQFAEQIGLRLKVVHETIRKYKSRLEGFGPLPFETAKVEQTSEGKWIRKEIPDHYKLTENHCYFLGSLSKNTEEVVEFKMWLVSTFSTLRKERTLNGPMYELLSLLPANWEGLIQCMLCHLSSYTEHPYRQEVTLNNKHRVDVLMSNKEALEIKNHMINPCHIKEILFNKTYWSQLKEQLPEFETLYITSTKGISQDALNFIKVLEPEIKYISLKTLFQELIPNKDIPLHLFPNV